MKKIYVLLLTLSCATITHNSFTMMRKILTSKSHISQQTAHISQPTFDNSKILITKKSNEKIQLIGQDYQIISNLINNKSKKLNNYTKPSDLINDLSQDKSTKHMHPHTVFFQADIKFLDQRFEEKSKEYNTDYAWHLIIFLMHTKLENTSYSLSDYELKHSAALVSLKQEQKLPKLCIYELANAFGDYDNTIPFNIERWSEKEKETIIEEIKNHKNILAKEAKE